MDDPLKPVLLEIIGHVGPTEVDPAPEERMDVRYRGIHEGRDEETSSGGSHLMFIDVDLRDPVVVQDLGHSLRLRQVKHEPITIIVMAGIMLVQPRHPASFVFCSDIFPVPIDHHLFSVRV
jgi:hypothetical protein